MARSYWLVKTEPGEYGWDLFLKEGSCYWDGVRNYQARNNLKAMREGDHVLWYHSVGDKEVVGIAEVTREHYPDPTTDDERWVVVDLRPAKELKRAVHLSQIKARPELADIALIRQSRLSVMPLTAAAFKAIVDLGEGTQKPGRGPLPANVIKPTKKKAKKKAAKKKAKKKKKAAKKSTAKTRR